MSIFLGIDIGTSGTKTLAINAKGKILAEATETYPAYHPKPLWSEQDPDDWWRATVGTVRAVVQKAKLKPADVQSIGLSGQMHGSVFLDKQNRVVRRAILWNDQRTAAECAEIERRAGGRRQLIKMVANPALPGFTAPKILWLRNHEPRNFDRTVKILLPKDDIRRRLTGEFATEVSDASGMLLLDVAKRAWSKPLLSKLELDIDLFGRCYESEEVTGQLTRAAADELGLTTDCVVVGGAGDCAAGAIGNGIVSAGTLSTSIGTSGVMFVHSDELQIDPEGRLHTFCHAVRGQVAHDGREPVGRRLPAMVPQSALPGGSRGGAKRAASRFTICCRKKRRPSRRAAKGCFSCRISPANERRTPIPTPAAASSA